MKLREEQTLFPLGSCQITGVPEGSEYFSAINKPPVELFYYWMVVHASISMYGIRDYLFPILTTILIGWMILVFAATCVAIYSLFHKYRLRRYTQGLQRLMKLYNPQLGEETKRDRRRKYYKRQQAREKRRRREARCGIRYKPQSGMMPGGSISSAFTRLASVNGIPIDDDLLDKIENLGAVYAILRESVSTVQLCGTLFLYFKTLYKKSVAMTAAQYLAQICELDFSPQSGEFSESTPSSFGLSDSTKPKWLKLLKECKENWTLVIRNEGFKKISQILSLSIALGLCEASQLDFRVGGMKLFSIAAESKHASAVDLIDAVFETVVYFAEGGYMCFERGTIKPLLYGNMENEEFEDCYCRCQQGFDYAKAGNLAIQGMDDNDYELLLCQTIEKCQSLVRTSRGTVETNIMRRKLDILRSWQASFRQTRVQGGLRCAPYSIGVFGTTGVGKSSVANIMMVTTLLHNGFNATDEHIITMNETDKFMSNYRSYINGILLDDIGNTKANFVERSPTSLMIQLVNNVRTYANMAEAELKGKVSVEPKVVISTKNVKDTCASVYSNEPASIARRDRITLTVNVREEFRSDGMLDSDKVTAYYGHDIPKIPDLWEIKVEKAYPVPNKVVGKPDTIGWQVVRWEGVPLDGISIHTLIRFVASDSSAFYSAQKQLVDNQNNMASKFKLCSECGLVSDVCQCNAEIFSTLPRINDDCCCSGGYCVQCEAIHAEEAEIMDQESYTPPTPVPVLSRIRNSLAYLRSKRFDTPMPDLLQSPYDTQFGALIATTISSRIWRWQRRLAPKFDYWLKNVEDLSTEWIIRRLDWLETSPFVMWTNWVPTDWLGTDTFKALVWLSNKDLLESRIKWSYGYHLTILMLILCSSWYQPLMAVFLIIPLCALSRIVFVEKKRLYDQVARNNQAMPMVFKMYRDRHVKWITGVCVTVAAVYAVACVWKALRVVPTPQGNLAPTGDQDIKERDEEINPWAAAFTSEMPASEQSRTTDVDTLESMVLKNTAHMLIGHNDRQYHCDAFFPCSNVALVPNHMWLSDNLHVKFTRHDPKKIGGNFEAWLYKGHSYRIPDTDLSLVWVPNGGDWKDLSPYFPLKNFANVPARMVYKHKTGEQLKVKDKTPKVMMNSQVVMTKVGNYEGHTYTLNFDTFEGLCMATLVTETKGPTIGGFHLSGINGTPKGASGVLTLPQLQEGLKDLRSRKCVILSKSEGTVPKELYNIQFYQNSDIHPKSPVNFLPEGTNCKYYGQVTGRAKYHTEVEPTIISAHVEDVCGVPQKWGGPKFNKGYPWQASLQHSAKPSCGIEGELLEKAADDYCQGITQALKRVPSLKPHIRPLSEIETVCGIDGLRFIDKMPASTSIGFPLSGPKSEYLTFLDPKEVTSHMCPVELDPRFWKHAYEMEELYLKGERAYPIFKACLKDEPTKLTKDKVRVFQGAPVALQLLVRRYFLPVARTLSMLPLDSECAVGVNAQGPEWDQLAKYVMRFGKDRILAGDYSKYDLRMPSQVMFIAFRVMMDIARDHGYSERDLIVMEGIATDICYPLMAYNGDLIQHYGSNPSGQNLTVYINSIVNSLLFRCAYYHIYKERENLPAFRDVCSLITYGDDAKSSVHEQFPEFNHLAVADFLAQHDMKFTMPDKESEPTPYMTDEEADLLKRANVYSEDTGMIMGALDEDSIFKSLHATLKSKAITKEQQAMQNIDGALREWFLHGREVYEKRREQMNEIAERADIKHGCTVLNDDYDTRLEAWKEKYA